MNVAAHYRSLTAELESLRDRVRNFIQHHHWLTDGEWKESVLRSMIGRCLPDTVRIGRGFVLTPDGPSTQCDIILYRSDVPVLFREGDLVFVTADAVLAIVEVKSNVDRGKLGESIRKLGAIGQLLGPSLRSGCVLGIFSYESDIADTAILECLQENCPEFINVIDLLTIGCSTFVKWWRHPPKGTPIPWERWHAYRLENMSAGY